jgi:hypothetical protein
MRVAGGFLLEKGFPIVGCSFSIFLEGEPTIGLRIRLVEAK